MQNVTGDDYEEVILVIQNRIEVWSFAGTSPVKIAEYTVEGTIAKTSLGDLDGDGKQDMIITGDFDYCDGDFDYNGTVNFDDFVVFADEWMLPGAKADFDSSGLVDFKDLDTFIECWIQ